MSNRACLKPRLTFSASKQRTAQQQSRRPACVRACAIKTCRRLAITCRGILLPKVTRRCANTKEACDLPPWGVRRRYRRHLAVDCPCERGRQREGERRREKWVGCTPVQVRLGRPKCVREAVRPRNPRLVYLGSLRR